MKWMWILLAALTIVACGSRPFVGQTTTGRDPNRVQRHALVRAAADLACSPEHLVLGDLGAGGYRVDGCGRSISYTCVLAPTGGMRGGVLCEPIAAVAAPVVIIPQASPAPPPSYAAPSAETDAVRAALTSRAPSVLACVPDQAIALDVSWDANGALAVSLTGARAGSAEEACVRAAYAGVVVSPAGAGGRLLHPIQR